MSGKPRDLNLRVAISATIGAEIAGKLNLERNRSEIVERALLEYYDRKNTEPKIEIPKICICGSMKNKPVTGFHGRTSCPLHISWVEFQKSTPPSPPEKGV